MNHKFTHRETRKVMYMSDEGKKFHDKSPEADKYVYNGPITTSQQAAEEKAAAEKVEKPELNEEEELEQHDKNLKGKVKRDVVELPKDKVEDLVKDKKTTVNEEEELEQGDAKSEAKRKADADKLKDKGKNDDKA